jgi:hypothetical protein
MRGRLSGSDAVSMQAMVLKVAPSSGRFATTFSRWEKGGAA